jgi:hypothetical protein
VNHLLFDPPYFFHFLKNMYFLSCENLVFIVNFYFHELNVLQKLLFNVKNDLISA